MTDASGSRFSAGIWIFNQIIDRYATDGYAPPVSTLEAIDMAGRTGVLSEVDLNYPCTDPAITVDDVRKALEDANLSVTNITPSIYSRVFRNGSFSSADPDVRRQAADLAHQAVEVANTLGARYVKFWPGQDG